MPPLGRSLLSPGARLMRPGREGGTTAACCRLQEEGRVAGPRGPASGLWRVISGLYYVLVGLLLSPLAVHASTYYGES